MRNVVMCAACLATDVRMHSISSDHLLQAYLQLLGRPMCSYMPQMVCWECAAFVNRVISFRSKCERAYQLLQLLHDQGQEITEDCVKESERIRHDLTSSLTRTLLEPYTPMQCAATNNNTHSQDMQETSIKCEPTLEENASVSSKDKEDVQLFFAVDYCTQEKAQWECPKSRLPSLTFSNILCLSVQSKPNLTTTPIVIEECDGCASTEPASSQAGGDLDVGFFQERFVEFATNFTGNRRCEGLNNMRKKKIQRLRHVRKSSQHNPEVSVVNDGVPEYIHDSISQDCDDSTPFSDSVHTDAWTLATPSLNDGACALDGDVSAEEEMDVEPSVISGGEATQELIPGPNSNKMGTEKQVKNELREIRKGSEVYKLSKVRKKSLLEELLKSERKGADARSLLTSQEEDRVVSWILYLSNSGFPVTKFNLSEAILELLEPTWRREAFGISAPSWYKDFLIRHPDLSMRVKRCIKTTEATEWSVRIWFNLFIKWDIVVGELRDVFKDPRRVFHSEESAIHLCPSDSDVLVEKDSNKPHSQSETVDRVTISLTVSADGSMQSPLVLFPYEHTCVPESVRRKVPPLWALGTSKTGWTNGKCFYNYVVNVFYPWLIANQIPLPVILFLDGRTSYINVQLSEFCKEKGIYLTALLPNSHRFQPLECAVFRPLKQYWVNRMRKWRMETGKPLKQEDFCAEMDVCLKQTVTSHAIQEAFRCCGLYPLNPHNIDYVKLMACDKTDW